MLRLLRSSDVPNMSHQIRRTKSFEMHIKALVVFSSFSGPPPEKAETVPCPGPGGRWSGLDSAGVGSGGPAPGAMGEAACFFAFRSLAC